VAELGSSERIAPAVGRPASPLAIRSDREFFVGMRSPESAGGPRLRPVVSERLMMRRMLLGIKNRAEHLSRRR
jgi:hypothetical protein